MCTGSYFLERYLVLLQVTLDYGLIQSNLNRRTKSHEGNSPCIFIFLHINCIIRISRRPIALIWSGFGAECWWCSRFCPYWLVFSWKIVPLFLFFTQKSELNPYREDKLSARYCYVITILPTQVERTNKHSFMGYRVCEALVIRRYGECLRVRQCSRDRCQIVIGN